MHFEWIKFSELQRQKKTQNPAVFEKENVSQTVPCHGLITEGVIVRSH